MVGFTTIGWITIAVLVACYLFAFDPSDDPFAVDPKRPHPCHRPNPIDVAIFKRTRRLRNLVRRGEYYGSVMERILNKVPCLLDPSTVSLVLDSNIPVSEYSASFAQPTHSSLPALPSSLAATPTLDAASPPTTGTPSSTSPGSPASRTFPL